MKQPERYAAARAGLVGFLMATGGLCAAVAAEGRLVDMGPFLLAFVTYSAFLYVPFVAMWLGLGYVREGQ